MPKMKTHKGASKRFRVTSSGRAKITHAANNHYFERKTPSQKRRLEQPAFVHSTDLGRVKRLLPYAKITGK